MPGDQSQVPCDLSQPLSLPGSVSTSRGRWGGRWPASRIQQLTSHHLENGVISLDDLTQRDYKWKTIKAMTHRNF